MVDSTEIRKDVMFSTAYHFEFLLFLIIVLVCFILYFFYYFIKKRAFQDLGSFMLYGKVFFFALLLILLLIFLISQFIIIEITEGAEYASIIFTLINALLLGVYINITFSSLFNSKNKFFGYSLLLIVLYVAITGLGDIGLRLILNTEVYIPLVLADKIYESNTPQGIRFMFFNVVIIIVIFGVSFLLERKKKS